MNPETTGYPPFLRQMSVAQFVSQANKRDDDSKLTTSATMVIQNPEDDILLICTHGGRWKLPVVYTSGYEVESGQRYNSFLYEQANEQLGLQPINLRTYRNFASIAGQVIVPVFGTIETVPDRTRLDHRIKCLPLEKAKREIGNRRVFERLNLEIIDFVLSR